jgi:hypothetical protein
MGKKYIIEEITEKNSGKKIGCGTIILILIIGGLVSICSKSSDNDASKSSTDTPKAPMESVVGSENIDEPTTNIPKSSVSIIEVSENIDESTTDVTEPSVNIIEPSDNDIADYPDPSVNITEPSDNNIELSTDYPEPSKKTKKTKKNK